MKRASLVPVPRFSLKRNGFSTINSGHLVRTRTVLTNSSWLLTKNNLNTGSRRGTLEIGIFCTRGIKLISRFNEPIKQNLRNIGSLPRRKRNLRRVHIIVSPGHGVRPNPISEVINSHNSFTVTRNSWVTKKNTGLNRRRTSNFCRTSSLLGHRRISGNMNVTKRRRSAHRNILGRKLGNRKGRRTRRPRLRH